jgi:hypothetical protein
MPQVNNDMCKLEPLFNHDILNKQLKSLNALGNLNSTIRILMGAHYSVKLCNPIDYIYNSISCKLQHLKESEVETQFILKYMQSSIDLNLYKQHEIKIEVERIFKLDRDASHKHVTEPNSYLLWLSCNVEDVLSILKNGLQTVDGQAAISATDSFIMSNLNAHGKYIDQNEALRKYVFLCEIALGKCKEYADYADESDFELKPIAGCDSIKLCGQYEPNAKHTITISNGCKIPLGRLDKQNDSNDSLFNRFIIHDQTRIAFRYIIQYKQYN